MSPARPVPPPPRSGAPRGRRASVAGFTLVELLVGTTLSLIVMSAVFSSYLFLGRNLTRLANQQIVETEARRALSFFTQDLRVATNLTSPTTTSLTLDVPAPSGPGSTTVAYTYYATATVVGSVNIPAFSFVRRSPATTGTPQVLARDLVPLSFTFRYFDSAGFEYTSPGTNAYRLGIKQVSFSYVARTGSGVNGTLTPNYTAESPRSTLRGRSLLP